MKKLQLSKHSKKYIDKYVMVDDDIFEELIKYNWHYIKARKEYAARAISNKKILMHRFIYELKYGKIPKGYVIDHIDGNGLNNQISNLRLANYSENACNTKEYKNNSSGHLGISKQIGKCKCYWQVSISKNGKRYQRAFPYSDEGLQQAIEWRKQKSLELHEEFSIYNKPKK